MPNTKLRTPEDLIKAGLDNLPCGYPLSAPFKDRLRHYNVCLDPFCMKRNTVRQRLGMALAKGIGKAQGAK